MMKRPKRSGIDFFIGEGRYLERLKGARLAMITNQTGVSIDYRLSHCLVNEKFRLVKLFSPEHGLFGNCGAGEDVDFYTDSFTGLPVYSLYKAGDRSIADFLLEDVDVLVYDIQDVGVRCYTYISTLYEAMKTCQRTKTSIIVLDRAPMLGRRLDGLVLSEEVRSFVGIYEIPFRYGLTPGEFSKLVYKEKGYDFPLEIVGIDPSGIEENPDGFEYAFVPPSLSIPTFDSALAYCAMALLEGTNVSEGRGTSTPFQVFGAPYIEAKTLLSALEGLRLGGVKFVPASFTPSFSKHSGVQCQGCRMIFEDKTAFNSFETIAGVLDAIGELYPNDFKLLEEGQKIAKLLGRPIHAGMRFSSLLDESRKDCMKFEKRIEDIVLY